MKQAIRNFLKEQNILDFSEDYIARNEMKCVDGEIILSGNRLGVID